MRTHPRIFGGPEFKTLDSTLINNLNLQNQIILRDNGRVREMQHDKDKLEIVIKMVNSNMAGTVKRERIKKLLGHICSVCGSIPTLEVSFDVGDPGGQACTRLEQYCNECIKKVYQRESVLYYLG